MESEGSNSETFKVVLTQASQSMGLTLSDVQVEKMAQHFQHVLETNQKFNLTRITDPVGAASRLYADSLAPSAWAEEGNLAIKSVLDVGTGAGFPSVPVAIARPEWQVSAIDSTGKKARFVQACATDFAIKNLRAKQVRAGEASFKQRFDLIVAKAVGTLQYCIQTAARNVTIGGHLIVFKGRGLSDKEQQEGIVEAENHRMQLVDVCDYVVPSGDEELEHCLIVYQRLS